MNEYQVIQKFLDGAVDLSNILMAQNFEDELLNKIEGSYNANNRWGSPNVTIEDIAVKEYKIYLKQHIIPLIAEKVLPELLKNDWKNDYYIKELCDLIQDN